MTWGQFAWLHPQDSRTVMVTGSVILRLEDFNSPLILCRRRRAAMPPSSADGCRTAVIGGLMRVKKSTSSNPATATSLPISIFNSWSVSITQIVAALLAVNNASGRLGEANSSDKADFAEEKSDNRTSLGHGSFACFIVSLYPIMRCLIVNRCGFTATHLILLKPCWMRCATASCAPIRFSTPTESVVAISIGRSMVTTGVVPAASALRYLFLLST